VRPFFVYMITNKRNGTLYIGMTDDLERRMQQHRLGMFTGFASKYGLLVLAWFEVADSREAALMRERQLKKWNRAWKIRLIEETNPGWRDLAEDFR
jgi:putative endonuclease